MNESSICGIFGRMSLLNSYLRSQRGALLRCSPFLRCNKPVAARRVATEEGGPVATRWACVRASVGGVCVGGLGGAGTTLGPTRAATAAGGRRAGESPQSASGFVWLSSEDACMRSVRPCARSLAPVARALTAEASFRRARTSVSGPLKPSSGRPFAPLVRGSCAYTRFRRSVVPCTASTRTLDRAAVRRRRGRGRGRAL